MNYPILLLPVIVVVAGLFNLPAASAHENYVLPAADIARGMSDWNVNVFDALQNPANLKVALLVAGASLLVFILYYFLALSKIGLMLDDKLKQLEPLGHVILRLALGASFIASALFHSFLGPEIPLTGLPWGQFWQPSLFALGGLLILGWFTEIAAVAGLILMLAATLIYGDYMLTYFNYFGEFIALLFFGSRFFSLDRFRAGATNLFQKYQQWEIPIIRITYGISVLYPAIVIKILHPAIILQIVNQYHLNQIHWLFPSDPLLISLGTGLAQIVVGLFIILGFETRLNSAITFVLYVLSIAFFREAVWPHYILLALGLYLVTNNGGGWSVDGWLRKKRHWLFGGVARSVFTAGIRR